MDERSWDVESDEDSMYVIEDYGAVDDEMTMTQLGLLFHSEVSDGVLWTTRVCVKVEAVFDGKKFNEVFWGLFGKFFVLRVRKVEINDHFLAFMSEKDSFERIRSKQILNLEEDDWKNTMDSCFVSKDELYHILINDLGDCFEFGLTYHNSIMDNKTVMKVLESFQACYLDNDFEVKTVMSEKLFKQFVLLENICNSDKTIHEYWEERISKYHLNVIPLISKSISPKFENTSWSIQSETYKKLVKNYPDINIKTIILGIHMKVMGVLSGEKYVTTGYEIEDPDVYGATQNFLPVTGAMRREDTWSDYFSNLQEFLDNMQFLKFSTVEMQKFRSSPLFCTLFSTIKGDTDISYYSKVTNMLLSTTLQIKSDSLKIYLNFDKDIGNLISTTIEKFQLFTKLASENRVSPHMEQINFQFLSNYSEEDDGDDDDVRIESLFNDFVEKNGHSTTCIQEFRETGVISYSYDQVNNYANTVSSHLQPEEVVGIYCERNHLLIVAILAVLKAGATFVILDPRNPRSYNLRIFEKITSILSVSKYKNFVTTISTGIECFDIEQILLGSLEEDSFSDDISPGNTATYFYSLGRYGDPVGVSFSHKNIIEMSKSIPVLVDAKPKLLLISPKSEIRFLCEIFITILNGGTLLIRKRKENKYSETKNITELANIFEETQAEVAWLHSNLSSIVSLDLTEKLRGLKVLLFGSGNISVDTAEVVVNTLLTLQKRNPLKIFQIASNVETTGVSCIFQITRQNIYNLGSGIPLGTPVAGLEAIILDRTGMPVPIGTPGEVYLLGDMVSDGFIEYGTKLPKTFLRHTDGRRMLKTGDLARSLPDGTIEFLSFIGQDTNLNGRLISLKGLARIILRHSSIDQVGILIVDQAISQREVQTEKKFVHIPGTTYTVEALRSFKQDDLIEIIVQEQNSKKDRKKKPKKRGIFGRRKDVSMRSNDSVLLRQIISLDRTRSFIFGKKQLIAYYTLQESSKYDFSESVLLESLKTNLPGYAIPQLIQRSTSFDMIGKKINYRRLAEENARSTEFADFMSSKSGTSNKLTNIWKDILRLPKNMIIQDEDSFFQFTTQSLDLLQLIKKIRIAFNVELSYIELMNFHLTIPTLEELIEESSKKPIPSDMVTALIYQTRLN